MNKFYDKLLLVVALLLLLGGVGVYLSGSKVEVPSIVNGSNVPFEVIPAPVVPDVEVTWSESQVQMPSEFLYDVFTPPNIELDKDGNFVAWSPWSPPPEPVPFGVLVKSISRDLYRVQLKAYVEEDASDPSKVLCVFVDTNTGESIRIRPGDTSEAAAIELISFSVERDYDPATSTVTKIASAKAKDLNDGQIISFVHGEDLYEDSVSVVLVDEATMQEEVVLKEVNSSFEFASGNYLLKEINLEASSVTVEKLATETTESQTETLFPKEINYESKESEEALVNPDANGSGDANAAFDFLF